MWQVTRASLHVLSRDQAVQLLSAPSRQLGCASLRPVPKGHGSFRTILGLHQPAPPPPPLRRPATPPHLGKSVNASLAHLLPLLASLRHVLPSALGTSVLGMTDAQRRWRSFVADRRCHAPSMPLHFRSTDLTGCYDTIAQVRPHTRTHRGGGRGEREREGASNPGHSAP